MLYCRGSCGDDWLDKTPGCQQSDADAYCRLKLCKAEAKAISYDIGATTNHPGFGCQKWNPRSKNFGAWLGINDVWFYEDMSVSYYCGNCDDAVVRNVICTDMSMYIV